jgi:hypothetical protein
MCYDLVYTAFNHLMLLELFQLFMTEFIVRIDFVVALE